MKNILSLYSTCIYCVCSIIGSVYSLLLKIEFLLTGITGSKKDFKKNRKACIINLYVDLWEKIDCLSKSNLIKKINSVFGSNRSSKCPSVCLCDTKLSRALNLHLSDSENTQTDCVVPSDPYILRLVFFLCKIEHFFTICLNRGFKMSACFDKF